jgi:hypothetical protein
LGLIHGHFDVQNLNDDVVNEDANHGLGSINSGIGVVIPIEKILAAIEQEALVIMRKETIEDMGKPSATADVSLDEKIVEVEQVQHNTSHKEDFMSLLNEAARSNK